MTALEIGCIDLGPDRFTLGCFHQVEGDRQSAPKIADGWYAALYCPVCGRKREVAWVAFGAPSDALSTLA